MAHSAKRRRLGQTTSTGLASLHPHAQDKRAAGGKANATSDYIAAPPLSSSEEDESIGQHDENEIRTNKKPIWKRPPKHAAKASADDSPFGPMSSQTRQKTTYARANAVRSGRPDVSEKSNLLSAEDSASAKLKKLKEGKSPPQKGFRAPAEINIAKRKTEFRLPAAVDPESRKASFRLPAAVEPKPAKPPAFRMPSGALEAAERLLLSSSPPRPEVGENGSTSGTQIPSSQSHDIFSSNTATSFATSLADADRELSPDTFSACPVCGTLLSEELLDAFRSSLTGLSAKSRYHKQTAFCRAHREEDARNLWEERGYPTIDWPALPTRFEAHRATILELLENRRASHFRAQLQAKTDARRVAGLHTGRDTLAQEFERADDGAESVGYYGGRGAQLMMNWLAQSLAEPLRAARETDPLLKASGSVSAFVQQVLVPELATILVVEDMRLAEYKARSNMKKKQRRLLNPPITSAEEDAARWEMRESAELGKLLCLEEDDEILAEDDEVEEHSGSDDLDSEQEDVSE